MTPIPASRHIAAPRVPAPQWRQWLERHVPPSPQPLVDPRRRLVVVAPHPDDEVLACALLMQQHAAHGGALHIVGVTDGEASHAEAGQPTPWLAALRDSERQAGLARLGLAHVPVTRLHLPDGAVAEAGARLHAALMALLRPADALVTTWRLDGHPDHECCGRVALDVSRRLGLPLLQAPVWMWHWAVPQQPDIDWSALRCLPAEAPAWEAKRVALQEHRSQWLPRSPQTPPVLDAAIIERAAWPCEYFFV
ncbi:PIG-L family deacetylase [Melaminivora suipulveris]|uniref:PIG-L family deacetylase n=1 Tax=Melaminivora suipulveris TaxID=2109913 RepID=A0A2R3QAP2_9BURK|nr:PIG-L family deacetylase [Melaminivora suipulveris]AVO48707.1 PIG-L family deacetylase [Melaminivora suipulveris]